MQFLIESYLTNSTKYRGVGLDIRTNGGLIVIEPSTIDNKCYKFVKGRSFSDIQPIEMPESLIRWLLIEKVKITQHIKSDAFIEKPLIDCMNNADNMILNISNENIVRMLMKLDDSYCDDLDKWLFITNILKNSNCFTIWDDWSTMSKKYNYNTNVKIWNASAGIIDINFLIYILNKTRKDKLPLVQKFKTYKPICNVLKFDKNTYDKKWFSITDDEFNKHSTIIGHSCTGTGKTTETARAIKSYNLKQKKPFKILSIISKQNLAGQHIKSFSEADIPLVSYQDDDKKISHDNIVCCINSIMILKNIPTNEFKNYIVYIDETSMFSKDLTHNETLKGRLKSCYQILMRIIKNCHKLILTDARINDNAFNLSKTRLIEQTLYIRNNYKKYQNVPAIKLRDENMLLEQMLTNINETRYFLAASDSCTTITQYYHKCKKEAPSDAQDNFILITSETPYKIVDATEQFKDKYIFYSPSIIASIDVSFPDAQDVFIYNKGRTIDPSDIFQQTTRTRNINKLYYYSEVKSHQPIYNSLEECRSINLELTTTSKEIFEVCSSNDNADDEIINENTFFELFVYNEYVADIFNTNKTIHYENILKEEGFNLSTVGNAQKLDKTIKDEMTEAVAMIKEETFNELIETGICDDNLTANLTLLGLEANIDNDILLKYKIQITDKFKLLEHLNIIRTFKDDLTIEFKIAKIEEESYNIQCLGSIYHKISIVRQLAKDMNVIFLDVNIHPNDITFNVINDKKWLLMQKMFRINRKIPTTKDEMFKLYISLLKHITTTEIILTKKNTTLIDKKRGNTYILNKELIKHHIELDKFMNEDLKNYDIKLLKMFDIEKPKKTQYKINKNIDSDNETDMFIDSDDETDGVDDKICLSEYVCKPSRLDYGIDEDD